MSYLFAFSYCSSWGSQGKNTEGVCHSLLQWTTFCQTPPPWPCHLGWPHTAWLSFIELHMTVVLWSDWLIVCDCSFRMSTLWSPLAVPTRLFGFFLRWTWGLSLQLLQQSAAAAPYLRSGVPLLGHHPTLRGWVAPLGHACAPSQPLCSCSLAAALQKIFTTQIITIVWSLT